MKKAISILLIVFVSSVISKAQTISLTWSRSLDGYGDLDQYVDAGTDASGNVYVAGWTKKTSSDYNWIIMKYNSSGTRQWLREYNPGTLDQAASMVVKGSYVYVTGKIKPSTYSQLAVLKLNQSDGTDAAGPYTYSNASYDVEGVVVKVGQNGSIYVGGNAYHPSNSGAANFLLYKITTAGTTTTNDNDYNQANTPDTLRDMVLGANDTVYATGSELTTSNKNFLTRKFDSTLIDQWTSGNTRGVTYDNNYTNGYDAAVRILALTSTDVFVTGISQSGTLTYDIATVKYNAAGTQQGSTARFTTTAHVAYIGDMGMDSAQSKIYICGADGAYHEVVLGYNTSLTQQFVATIGAGGGPNILTGKKLKVDRSGNIWTAIDADDMGNTYTYGSDIALTVFNSSGTFVASYTFDATYGTTRNGTGPNDVCYAMANDGNSGDIFLAGSMNPSVLGNSGSQDFLLVKFGTSSTFPPIASRGPGAGLLHSSAEPLTYGLSQNYPNPFNPSTIIRYTVPEPGRVSLRIYDVLGREVKLLIDDQFVDKGVHQVSFDASRLSTGPYYYEIVSGGGKFHGVKKMLFVK